MPTCEHCGEGGACFCSEDDQLDQGVGGWYHVLCYAKQPINYRESLRGNQRRNRSHARDGVSGQARASMRKLRVEPSGSKKPISRKVPRML